MTGVHSHSRLVLEARILCYRPGPHSLTPSSAGLHPLSPNVNQDSDVAFLPPRDYHSCDTQKILIKQSSLGQD